MDQTKKSLKKITAPVLVIQGDKDPVVNAKSAEIIMNNVQTTQKEFFSPAREHHIIIKGEGSEEIFKKVIAFMKRKKRKDRS